MPIKTFFNSSSFNGHVQSKSVSPVTMEYGPLTHFEDEKTGI